MNNVPVRGIFALALDLNSRPACRSAEEAIERLDQANDEFFSNPAGPTEIEFLRSLVRIAGLALELHDLLLDDLLLDEALRRQLPSVAEVLDALAEPATESPGADSGGVWDVGPNPHPATGSVTVEISRQPGRTSVPR